MSRSLKENLWKSATFCVFDAPEKSLPFESRISYLKDLQQENQWPSFIKVIDMVQCKDNKHFQEFFNEIIKNNGEGVMLRKPLSLYDKGRSNSLRRYKEYPDTEVIVTKNMYPHGLECKQ